MPFDNTGYMNDLSTKAQNLGNTAYTGFGQSTQVDANPWQQQSWQNTFNRGMQGSAEVDAARGQLQSTIGGGGFSSNPFMGQSNPYLQSSIDSTLGDMTRNYNNVVKPQTESAMAGSGSFGNSGLQQMQGEQQRNLQDSMGKTASNMRFADYQNQSDMYNKERDRQMQGTLAAPNFANVDYTDLQAMQQAGNALQGQNQGERTSAYNQYLDAREWPFKTVGAQASAMGSGGVGSANYQQQQPNTGANIMGGALAGAQLGSSFGGWGTAGSPVLGGLLGGQ
jgi:hypothetical protein